VTEEGVEAPPVREEEEEAHETLLGAFRQRALALLRAERSLRLYTGIAIAELFVCTILVLAGDLPLPRMGITSGGNSLDTIPIPILVLSLALQAIAWGMFLTGLLDTRWPVLVAGLALFYFAFGQFVGPLSIFPVYLYFLLLLLVAVSGLIAVGRWRRRGGSGLPGFGYFLANVFLVAAVYALAWLESTQGGSAVLFGLTLSVQLGILSFLIITVLFLAGTDFAEWGEVAGERLGTLAQRLERLGAWVVAAIVVAVSVAILADTIRQYQSGMVQQLMMAVLALALVGVVVLAARALRHRRPVRMPVVAMVVAAGLDLIFFVTAVLAAGAVSTTPAASINGISFATYQYEKEPKFSIERPALWEVQTFDSGPGLVYFSGLHAANQGLFYVISMPAAEAGEDPMATWVKLCCPGQTVVSSNPRPHGPWTEADFTDHLAGGDLAGTTWTRTAGGRVWLLYGLSNPSIVTLNTPVFRHMVDTWREGTAPPVVTDAAAKDVGTNRTLAVNAGLWLLVALAAGLFLLFRRRARPALATAAIFLMLVGGLYTLQSFGQVLAAFGLRLQIGPVHVQGLRIQGEQAAVAIITLAAVFWFAARRRLQAGLPVLVALVGLSIGLQVLSWMFWVFDQKQSGGNLTAIGLSLVTLALLWDIVMSGGAMAQGHGRWFPRHSRVLIYFGFDVLVAATVLYFESLRNQATGQADGLALNTDFWPQTGLIILGIPMLLALFILKLGRLSTRSHHREPKA
jgi:hypothetical protein